MIDLLKSSKKASGTKQNSLLITGLLNSFLFLDVKKVDRILTTYYSALYHTIHLLLCCCDCLARERPAGNPKPPELLSRERRRLSTSLSSTSYSNTTLYIYLDLTSCNISGYRIHCIAFCLLGRASIDLRRPSSCAYTTHLRSLYILYSYQIK